MAFLQNKNALVLLHECAVKDEGVSFRVTTLLVVKNDLSISSLRA